METISVEDRDNLRQELLYESKKGELEGLEHEANMRDDLDYFCDWCLDNLFRNGGGYSTVSLRDTVELLNETIKKYDQDIDEVYEWLKEI